MAAGLILKAKSGGVQYFGWLCLLKKGYNFNMKNSDSIKNKTIFLIEDDKFLSKLLGGKLTNAGCNYIYAADANEAIAILEHNIPDVIILDLLLPGGIDGFSLLQKIKSDERLKNIPVIILSNLSSPGEIAHGMKLGAYRYLVKASIVPDEVLDHIESALLSGIK